MKLPNDARDPQPKAKVLNLTKMGSGSLFQAVICTWPYSSLDPQYVYPEELTVNFRARDFRHAVDFADAMSVIIAQGHDVWQSNVIAVRSVPHADHFRVAIGR